jgi:hypothetical protein
MDTAPPTPLAPLLEASRLLRVPAAWLRAEAEAGRLPHLRAGKSILFDVDLVERLLIERARRPVSPTEEGDPGA